MESHKTTSVLDDNLQRYLSNSLDKSVFVSSAWRLLRLRMEERLPDMENSCEYVEKEVAGRQQGVVLQLGGWAKLVLTVKT